MHLCYRVLGERCVGVSVMYHGARQTPRAITFLQTEHSFSPLLTIKICHPPSTTSSKNPLPSATTLSKLFVKYLFSNQPKSICFIFCNPKLLSLYSQWICVCSKYLGVRGLAGLFPRRWFWRALNWQFIFIE